MLRGRTYRKRCNPGGNVDLYYPPSSDTLAYFIYGCQIKSGKEKAKLIVLFIYFNVFLTHFTRFFLSVKYQYFINTLSIYNIFLIFFHYISAAFRI